MINITDKDGDSILEIDENEKPIKQIIGRQKIITAMCIIMLSILITIGGIYVKKHILDQPTGITTMVEAPYTPNIIPEIDPIAVPIPTEDDVVSESKLPSDQMSINMFNTVVFKDAYASGHFNITNSSINNYPQFVTITLNNDNTVIYQSGLIEPGKCIAYDTLDVVLPKGEYNCTATFVQVNPASQQICGKAAANVVITIKQ